MAAIYTLSSNRIKTASVFKKGSFQLLVKYTLWKGIPLTAFRALLPTLHQKAVAYAEGKDSRQTDSHMKRWSFKQLRPKVFGALQIICYICNALQELLLQKYLDSFSWLYLVIDKLQPKLPDCCRSNAQFKIALQEQIYLPVRMLLKIGTIILMKLARDD